MNNDKFYDTLTVDTLDKVAEETFGTEPPSDFCEFEKYINEGDSVLEVGAGTGRIGLELIKKQILYTGVEKQSKFLDIFKKNLNKLNNSNLNNIVLLNCPFENISEKYQFDVIIFPWTVMGDFSKSEQNRILGKTYNKLRVGGVCLIDNPSKNQKYNQLGEYAPTCFYYIDWMEIFNKIGFDHKSYIYKTKTNRERELIILKKKS